jgi:hypothetical protein
MSIRKATFFIEFSFLQASHDDTDPYDTTSPPIPIGPHWMIMWPFDPEDYWTANHA